MIQHSLSVAVVCRLNKVANYSASRFSSGHIERNVTRSLAFCRYLKEIGYVDTIIDIRSTAVKKLLGIKSEPNVNGGSPSHNGETRPTNDSKRYTRL